MAHPWTQRQLAGRWHQEAEKNDCCKQWFYKEAVPSVHHAEPAFDDSKKQSWDLEDQGGRGRALGHV